MVVALPTHIADEDPEDWGPCISTAEWILMYLRGLTITQISQYCRVPKERVRQFIRSFERNQPDLAGKRLILINRPAPPSAADLRRNPQRPSWDCRLIEAKEFRRLYRRMPRVLSDDPREQSLAAWIAGQRKQLRRGKMSVERQEMLWTALGDWVGIPRPVAESTQWDQRLAAVADILARKGHPPRYGKQHEQSENTLATWLVTQRALLRRLTLDPNRRIRLDEQIPGWDTSWR